MFDAADRVTVFGWKYRQRLGNRRMNSRTMRLGHQRLNGAGSDGRRMHCSRYSRTRSKERRFNGTRAGSWRKRQWSCRYVRWGGNEWTCSPVVGSPGGELRYIFSPTSRRVGQGCAPVTGAVQNTLIAHYVLTNRFTPMASTFVLRRRC